MKPSSVHSFTNTTTNNLGQQQQQQLTQSEASKLTKFIQKKDVVKSMFESHRTFLSLTATLLSCAAAWLGYEARLRHQKKLEDQLLSINEELKRDYDEMERVKSMSRAVTRTDYVSIASFTVASLVIGYTVGRFHGRRSALRRMEQQIQLAAKENTETFTAAPSSISEAAGKQRSFGRIFTKLKQDTTSDTAPVVDDSKTSSLHNKTRE